LLFRPLQPYDRKSWATLDHNLTNTAVFHRRSDPVTNMILALRSRRQPIREFSYPKTYEQLLVHYERFEVEYDLAFLNLPDFVACPSIL
jgi:hypothetical protein